MRVSRPKRRLLPAVTLVAVVVVMLVMTALSTYQNLDRSRRHMEASLRHVGLSLIKGLEAGTRAGMRRMPWERRALQHLVEEMGRDKAVRFIVIFNRRGQVLAHSDSRLLGARLKEGRDFFKKAPTGLARRFGERVFLIGRPFTPLRGFGRRRHMMMMQRGQTGGDIGRQTEDPSRVLRSPLYCLVGLSTDPYEAARRQDLRHGFLMAAVLFVLGLAGLYFIMLVQNSRLVERTLTELQSYTQLVVDNVPEGLITTDQDGRIAAVNARVSKMLGRDEKDLVRRNLKRIFTAEPVWLKKTLAEGEPVVEQREALTGAGDVPVPVAVSAAPLTDGEGRRLGTVFVIRDMSEIERLREELSRNQRLAALGRLAAGVAHEIRNPLSSIRGLVSFLKKKFEPDSAEDQYAKVVISEVDRMGRVIGGLLDFARPKEPEVAEANVEDLIRHGLTLVADEAGAAGIEVEFKADGDLPRASCDPDQVTQVILNLLVNAVEAMESGGRLGVEAARQDDFIEVRVSDTGPGISPENLTRLFDPFFTTKKKGSGLGLAIAQRIVDNHGGTLRAESAPGKGTVFVLRLPISGEGKEV